MVLKQLRKAETVRSFAVVKTSLIAAAIMAAAPACSDPGGGETAGSAGTGGGGASTSSAGGGGSGGGGPGCADCGKPWGRSFPLSSIGSGDSKVARVGASGDLFVFSQFVGALDLDCPTSLTGQGNNMFAARLDAGGKCVYNKQFQMDGGDAPLGFVVDGDETVLVGLSPTDFEFGGACGFHVQGDGFIARLDESGECLWSKVLNKGLSIDRVEPLGAGHFVALGEFHDKIDLGGPCQLGFAGESNLAIAKFDTKTGDCVGIKRIDVSSMDFQARFIHMVEDGTGDLFLAGPLSMPLTFDGCQTMMPSAPMTGEIFAAKLNSDGACLWSRSYPMANSGDVSEVARSAAGNLLIAGEFFGPLSFGVGPDLGTDKVSLFVAELGVESGTPLWARQFGKTTQLYSSDMAVDPAGNIVVAGTMNDDVNFGGGILKSAGAGDIFLLKLDSEGNYLFSDRRGSVGDDMGKSIVSIDACGALLFGEIGQTTDFGCGVSLESSGNDSFFAKIPLGP